MFRYTIIINSEKIVTTSDKKKIHRLLKRCIISSNSAVDAIIEKAEECGKIIATAEFTDEFFDEEQTFLLFAFEE